MCVNSCYRVLVENKCKYDMHQHFALTLVVKNVLTIEILNYGQILILKMILPHSLLFSLELFNFCYYFLAKD